MNYIISKTHEKDPVEPRNAVAEALTQEAQTNNKIVVFDADLIGSSGLAKFQNTFPKRMFNVGIMEAHMVGAAAGMSITGFTPFIHSFAPFASRRVFDQAVLSGAYSDNSITIIGTDPGINSVYNGGTHTALEDIAMYRSVPNTMVFDISDSIQADAVIRYRIKNPQGLCYIRLARRGLKKIYEQNSIFTPGQFPIIREGKDVTIFTTGILVSQALDAANILEKSGISVRILDCFSLSHMDIEAIQKSAKETRCLVALDNHNIYGGLASAISDVLTTYYPAKLHRVGMTTFSEVGDLNYLLDKFGFTGEKLAQSIKLFLS